MSTNWKVSGWISSCCTLHIEVCLGKMLGCMAQILISLNQWFPPTVCCSSFTIYQIELWRMWVEKQKPIHIFLLPFSEISICNSWCHLSNHCVLNSFLFFFFTSSCASVIQKANPRCDWSPPQMNQLCPDMFSPSFDDCAYSLNTQHLLWELVPLFILAFIQL